MRSRFGYVSNSSSSSFILDDGCLFSAADVQEFIVDSMDSYEERVKEMTKARSEYIDIEEEWAHCIFCVFDLKDRLQNMEAKIALSGYLDGWDDEAALRNRRSGRLVSYGRWLSELVDSGKVPAGMPDSPIGGFSFELSCRCDYTRKWFGKRGLKDIGYEDVLRYAYSFRKGRNFAKCDNFEAMMAPNAAIAVHFDENEIWTIRGISDDEGYETENYTYYRFCELFVKWMQSKGRLPEQYSWIDMNDSTIACTMHEG